jgi:hypothetical protein
LQGLFDESGAGPVISIELETWVKWAVAEGGWVEYGDQGGGMIRGGDSDILALVKWSVSFHRPLRNRRSISPLIRISALVRTCQTGA